MAGIARQKCPSAMTMLPSTTDRRVPMKRSAR